MGQSTPFEHQLRAEDVGVAPLLADVGVDVSFLPPPPPYLPPPPNAVCRSTDTTTPTFARYLQVISILQAVRTSLTIVSLLVAQRLPTPPHLT